MMINPGFIQFSSFPNQKYLKFKSNASDYTS